MSYQELFTVEREDGETIDIQGDGGFSVFTNRAEALDALESEADSCDEERTHFKIVCFCREQPEEGEEERVKAGL